MVKNKRFEIPQPSINKNDKLTFSFEFYDNNGKYCLSKFKQGDVPLVLERLKQLNEKTINEILRDKNVLHFHEVYWERTTEKKGFPSSTVNSFNPFQFSLNGINNQKARIYGALTSTIFYIVWFDLEHQIWPSIKKHT